MPDGIGSARGLTPAQGVDDLDVVAVGQDVGVVATPRDDLAINLHRHAAPAQSLGLQQGGDRAARIDVGVFAVESDVHAAIVSVREARRTPAGPRA
ncbi:hypothetical protein BEN78_02445 [Xanthomonas citri pv. mangiferaeindicae]|nr:hypothetical protein BEN78_02445 [Xanthomonas citri pv. mangiferaeindicae]